MAAEEYLSNELQRLLEGFTKVQDVYLALQTYCELQDERISMERERSEKLRGNLEKVYEAYSVLQTKHKSAIEEFGKEKTELREAVEELREQCEHLRSVNFSSDNNEASRLQDELELLRVRLEVQEEKHKEDVALLKQQHSDEIQRYKMLLNAKQGQDEPKKKGRAKKAKRGAPPFFRWPELKMKVEAVRKTIEENDQETKRSGVKKRKLFSEEREAGVDIVQDES